MSSYKVIGVMSGTSLDGLDIAFCEIKNKSGKWQFDIHQAETIEYDEEMINTLKNAIGIEGDKLIDLHVWFGKWLGKQIKKFIKKYELPVDYIGCHGHTVHHRPHEQFTFQIGSGQHIANRTGITTVCDFRSKDVSLFGQGAPLVPIGDLHFFNDYDFCLNLGGISNISFNHKRQRIAYDVGLANMPLNYITEKINLKYDNDGAIARSGKINIPLLEKLNALEYYDEPPPKSTGFEWFSEKVLPIVTLTNASIADVLHTIIHHNCEQIARSVHQYKTNGHTNLLVTGGGALNSFFVETLAEKLDTSVKVTVPSKTLIEYKEALIFALMAVLRIEKQTNVLRSVTGAKQDSCSGVVYFPN